MIETSKYESYVNDLYDGTVVSVAELCHMCHVIKVAAMQIALKSSPESVYSDFSRILISSTSKCREILIDKALRPSDRVRVKFTTTGDVVHIDLYPSEENQWNQ